MTVWSLTPFFNELDVLEIRLAELDPVVDIHVICESSLTFAGDEKPFLLKENWERFKPWHKKIRYLRIVPATEGVWVPEGVPDGVRCASDRWAREEDQRRSIIMALEGMQDDDLVLVSDLDEIPRAECFEDVELFDIAVCPRLPLHVMWLNWRWRRPLQVIARFTTGRTINKLGVEGVRQYPAPAYGPDGDGERGLGWHLSYLGGVEAIQYKIRSAAHHELDRPPFNEKEWIETCMRTGRDLFGRYEKQAISIPESWLPEYVRNNYEKFEHLIGPDL